MLWTVFVILLILWLLGLMTGYTMGAYPRHSGAKAGVTILTSAGQGEEFTERSN